MPDRIKCVSVTGATGFLGWHLIEGFQREGWHARAIVRPGNRKPVPAGAEIVEASLESGDLARAFDGTSTVVHGAGLIRAHHEDEFRRVNVEGTGRVIEGANRAASHLIFISSQAAIGPSAAGRPSREDDVPRPLNAYGRSKLAAEDLLRSASAIPWTIIRPPAVYGPRDRGFLPLFRLASRGVFLMVARPSMAFTFVAIEDLVRGIVAAASNDAAQNQAFFIGHPTPSTAEDLMRTLAEAFARTYRPVRVPGVVVRAAGWLGDLAWKFGTEPLVDGDRVSELQAAGFVCAVDHVRERLGFTAEVPLHAGITETASWYRREGWI
jgi:nucleoside-diphosphate-sugar epimerase